MIIETKRETQWTPEREAQLEEECIRQVFGLTGGESLAEFRDAEGKVEFGYSYDGPPDWCASDFDSDKTYATGIVSGGGYLSPPPEEISAKNGSWRLAQTFVHPGECDCPAERGEAVTPEHCDGGPYPSRVNEEGEAEGRCMYCEAEIGAEHGCVYVGESYEAVYEFVPSPEAFIDEAISEFESSDCRVTRNVAAVEVDADGAWVTARVYVPRRYISP